MVDISKVYGNQVFATLQQRSRGKIHVSSSESLYLQIPNFKIWIWYNPLQTMSQG